jgi:hypothetical protein
MPTFRSFLKKFESAPTRLLRLSAEGKTEKVRDMLDKPNADWGKLLGARDDQGRTPFFLAAVNGYWEIARMLWIVGSDPTTPNSAGQTPLQALLAIPEPTEDQRRLITSLQRMARWQTIHPEEIANPEVRKELEQRFFPKTKVSPTALEVVGRNVEVKVPFKTTLDSGEVQRGETTRQLPRDVQNLIGKFGGRKTRSRKSKRRQTRRRR